MVKPQNGAVLSNFKGRMQMEITMGYPIGQALKVGRALDQAFDRDTLTGLNFIVKPNLYTIVNAVFNHPDHQPEPEKVEEIMAGGQLLAWSADDVVPNLGEDCWCFLGDGLPGFAAFCYVLSVRV